MAVDGTLGLVALGVLVVGTLLVLAIARHRRQGRARAQALRRLGFRDCPDRTAWLEETVSRLERTEGVRYEIRQPRRLPGEPAVYHYVKVRHRHVQDDAVAEEEILFPLKRPSPAGLVVLVKPSSLAPGLATRMLGAIAAGPWDAQAADLRRLELPADLRNTNVVAALGPPGAGLYDLIDSRALSVVQGLGDAGGMFVRCRESWCAVSGASAQIPYRIDHIVAGIRPLL